MLSVGYTLLLFQDYLLARDSSAGNPVWGTGNQGAAAPWRGAGNAVWGTVCTPRLLSSPAAFGGGREKRPE